MACDGVPPSRGEPVVMIGPACSAKLIAARS
jgi:hypothetical protein